MNKVEDRRLLCVTILLLLTFSLSVAAAYANGVRVTLVLFTVTAAFAAVLAGNQLGRERITTWGIHLLGVWLMLGVAPLLEYRSGLLNEHFTSYHFFPFLPTTKELALSSVAVVFWLLCVTLAYRANVDGAVRWIRAHDLKLSGFAIFAQIGVGIVALGYIYQQVGFGVFTRMGFESFEYDTPGEFAFFTTTVRPVPLIALLALTLTLQSGIMSTGARIAGVVAALALFVGNVLLNNPIAAARFFTGTFVLAFAYVLFFKRSRTGLSFLLVALVSALVLFPLVDVGRLASNLDTLQDDIPTFVARLFSEDPFRTFGMIPVALRFLEERGSTHGFQLLGPLLFWIPRSLWPDKPEGSGWVLAKHFGAFHENLSCPTPCEALLNFGWIGIPIIALIFAIGLKVVDSSRSVSSNVTPRESAVRLTDVIFPLLLGQVFFLTRGDFMSPWGYTIGMIMATAPLILGEMLSRATSRLVSYVSRRVPGA